MGGERRAASNSPRVAATQVSPRLTEAAMPVTDPLRLPPGLLSIPASSTAAADLDFIPGSVYLNPFKLAEAIRRKKACGNAAQASGIPRADTEPVATDVARDRHGNVADLRPAAKYREGDKIALPTFPQAGQFRSWKLNVKRQILAAPGRDGDASKRLRHFLEEVGSPASLMGCIIPSWRVWLP